MRPAISDSLISGQPLNLLYVNAKSFDAIPALRLASLAVQATGNVRLQVTGRPPTTSGSRWADLSPAQAPSASGTADASAPLRTCRRSKKVALMTMPGVPVCWRLGRSLTDGRIAFGYDSGRHRTYTPDPICHSSRQLTPARTLMTWSWSGSAQ